MAITFTDPLDARTAADPTRYRAKTWTIKRSANYGSDHFDERMMRITAARLSADGRTVMLDMPGIAPTRCMEITYQVKGATGEPVEGAIDNTIHQIPNGANGPVRVLSRSLTTSVFEPVRDFSSREAVRGSLDTASSKQAPDRP